MRSAFNGLCLSLNIPSTICSGRITPEDSLIASSLLKDRFSETLSENEFVIYIILDKLCSLILLYALYVGNIVYAKYMPLIIGTAF